MKKINFQDDTSVSVPIIGVKTYKPIDTKRFSIEVDAGNGGGVTAEYENGTLTGGTLSGSLVKIEIPGGSLGCGLLVAHIKVVLADSSFSSGERTERTEMPLDIYLGAASSDDASGSGVASGDYNDLKNKPSINGVTLSGDKTGKELHIITAADE